MVIQNITNAVFLDIDGPMVPMNFWSRKDKDKKGHMAFDPAAVATILRVLNETGAKLVISSSWRNIGYERMSSILEEEGISKDYLHEDWSIDFSYDVGMSGRADFIRTWLKRHPEIKHYAVVDDVELDIPNLVKVSTFDGMSDAHRRQLFELFNLN